MKRNLLLAFAFLAFNFFYGQYNESAPWMGELLEKNSIKGNSKKPTYTFSEITESFNNYWKDKDISKKGNGYKPFKRWENYWRHFVGKDGKLPTSKEIWASWQNKKNTTGKAVNPISDWNSLGPFSHGSFSGALPGQGRVNAIAVDPNNESIWYVGTPAGGIWKSLDAGETWTNLFDNFPQIGVSGIAIDPNNSNIIYIATGDDDAADSYSIGVFKSTDGGASWNETGLNPGNSDINLLMNEITIDPTNSNIIWVGTSIGLQKSIDGGDTWEIKRGGNIKDFKLKPGDTSTIYGVTTSAFIRSTDNGETFTTITDGLPGSAGRLVIGTSPDNPEVVYVLRALVAASDFAFGGLYKSTNSGESFTKTDNELEIFESSQAWFDLAIEVSPTDVNELYVGCLNMWKSTDGGDSFDRLNRWNVNTESYTHADIHTIKFFNNKLYVGSDGGIYQSADQGTSFEDFTSGIANSQFYRISVAKNDSRKIAGGLQDNSGFILENGNWNIYTGGDGMDYEIDPSNGNLLYGFVQFGGSLFISTDSGKSVGVVGAPRDTDGNPIQGNWITPLAVSSAGDVYSGFDALYKLEGNTWEKVSSAIGSGNIDDIEIDPNDPDTIFLAEGNILYRSQNGGATFLVATVLDSDISDMAINSNDPNIVYVTTSNRVGTSQSNQQTERGVFKITMNGNTGSTEDITLNIPADQAFFSIVHQGRHTDNPIYVGTSLGVYRLDDTLSEWEDYFTNFPSTAVSDLEINVDGEKIIASTYGRGVWESNIPIQVPENEVRLISITPEANTVLCGEITPVVEIQNQGVNPVTSVDIVYTIGSIGPKTFNWTGNLLNNQIEAVTLPSETIIDYDAVDFEVTINTDNDTYSDNNELSHRIFLNEFGTGGAVSTFENPEDRLIAYNDGGEGSIWERGEPSGAKLNLAASGTNVYATNLSGDHTNNTKGILLSKCYELSSILAPKLKFNMAYDLEINFDIVYVEYSINDGSIWNVLGNVDSEPNWYNSDRTNANSEEDDDCQNCPGAQWTGENTTLTEYSYDFTANAARGEVNLTGESNVLFRIVFQSDPAVTQEGVVIDDFVVDGFQDDDDDDNDGIPDLTDNCPLLSNSNQLDTNNDGEGDVCDDDDDGDGILDSVDNCPLIANPAQIDTDNDGIGDVCDDDNDNDGVPNIIDQCDNTPENSVVDINGCQVFSLPSTNFRVLVTDESCISSNNGSIKIEAQADHNYTAILIGSAVSEEIDFISEALFDNLEAGVYSLCFTVDGEVDYQSCMDLEVGQPEALTVTSKINSLDNEVTLSLSGSTDYTIEVNGILFKTSKSEITLPLDKPSNLISVKTGLSCQGTHLETVILSSELFVYPNPIASGDLKVFLGNNQEKEATIVLFDVNGLKILKKSLKIQQQEVRFNIDNLPIGVYLLNVKNGAILSTYKIIKK